MKANKPTQYAEKIKNLIDSDYSGPGHSDTQLRRAVARKVAAHCHRVPANSLRLPEMLEPYVDKIARHAYKVTDADVNDLRDAGYSEDVIFELTVSAALGAGIARLETGMAALKGDKDAA